MRVSLGTVYYDVWLVTDISFVSGQPTWIIFILLWLGLRGGRMRSTSSWDRLSSRVLMAVVSIWSLLFGDDGMTLGPIASINVENNLVIFVCWILVCDRKSWCIWACHLLFSSNSSV